MTRYRYVATVKPDTGEITFEIDRSNYPAAEWELESQRADGKLDKSDNSVWCYIELWA